MVPRLHPGAEEGEVRGVLRASSRVARALAAAVRIAGHRGRRPDGERLAALAVEEEDEAEVGVEAPGVVAGKRVSTFMASASCPGGPERSEGIQAMRLRRGSPGSQKSERKGWLASPWARAVRCRPSVRCTPPWEEVFHVAAVEEEERHGVSDRVGASIPSLRLPHPRIEGERLGRQEAEAREVGMERVQEDVPLVGITAEGTERATLTRERAQPVPRSFKRSGAG